MEKPNPFQVILNDDENLLEMIFRGIRIKTRGVCKTFRDLEPRPRVKLDEQVAYFWGQRRDQTPLSAPDLLATQQSMSVVSFHSLCHSDIERFNRIMEVLPQFETLNHLELYFYENNKPTDLSRTKIEHLAAVLPQCRSLTHLNLQRSKIESKYMRTLAAALPLCPSLTHLNLYYMDLGSGTGSGAGIRALAAVLPQCRSLTELNLEANSIWDKGVGPLAAVLPQCTSLAHLNVGGNHIGDEGMGRLAAVLPQCRSLAHLNVSSNYAEVQGAEMLAAVLPQCTSLTYLDMRQVFGKQGFARLEAVFPQCASLTDVIHGYDLHLCL